MKDTRLRKMLNQETYETVINKYKLFIKNNEKDNLVTLKTMTNICIFPNKSTNAEWRNPNDFLMELCTNEHVFQMFHSLVKNHNSDYTFFGRNLTEAMHNIL